MKTNYRILLSFIPSMVVIALIIYWAYSSTIAFDGVAYLIFALVLLTVGISLYFKIQSYQSVKAGLSAEDEFSNRIKEMASAKAFSWSIYLWTFVVLFIPDMPPRVRIIIGIGIVTMGLIFLLNWYYLSKVGLSDENED